MLIQVFLGEIFLKQTFLVIMFEKSLAFWVVPNKLWNLHTFECEDLGFV